NHELRWGASSIPVEAEQSARLRIPGQQSKLVYCSNEESRPRLVDRLIYYVKREGVIEITIRIIAAVLYTHRIRTLSISFDLVAAPKFNRSHLRTAPWATQHDKRVFTAAVQKLLKLPYRIIMTNRRHVSSNPQADGDRRLAEISYVAPAKLLTRAN